MFARSSLSDPIKTRQSRSVLRDLNYIAAVQFRNKFVLQNDRLLQIRDDFIKEVVHRTFPDCVLQVLDLMLVPWTLH